MTHRRVSRDVTSKISSCPSEPRRVGIAAIWLVGFLLVGLFEENLSRGYLQYTLTRGIAGLYQWAFKTRYSGALGFWTSAVILSIFFGLGHSSNVGESPLGQFSALSTVNQLGDDFFAGQATRSTGPNTGTKVFNVGTVTAPVPEPTAIALGVPILLLMRRARRR